MSMVAKTSPGKRWQKPAALRPGDAVAVIAPSGPVPSERLEAGLAVLSERYRVVKSDGLLDRKGFLAGEDGRRLAELRWALSDPQIRAVFCARGGHGLLRLVLPLLTARPQELPQRSLVGFSDVTVLHALLGLHERVTIHGPVITQLGELAVTDRESLWALLESREPPPPLLGLQSVAGSVRTVTGRLLGGNLEVLSRLCGTPLGDALLHSGEVVLLLEEVTEVPYRIDRALTQLRLAGLLEKVVAVVVGELLRCEGPAEHPAALAVIVERLGDLGMPVLAGAPIGHGARNRAVPLGVQVVVDPRRGCLAFAEAAVE